MKHRRAATDVTRIRGQSEFVAPEIGNEVEVAIGAVLGERTGYPAAVATCPTRSTFLGRESAARPAAIFAGLIDALVEDALLGPGSMSRLSASAERYIRRARHYYESSGRDLRQQADVIHLVKGPGSAWMVVKRDAYGFHAR